MNQHLAASALVSAPHAHDRSSVQRIMFYVCIALLPETFFAFYLFGWPAFYQWAVTCVAAVVTEYVCLRLMREPVQRIGDGSALLTGWLLALSDPPWAPWWIGAGGAVFAIGVGKHLYGGVGQNIFNPAMLARVALLISFPLQMSTWALPSVQQLHMPNAVESLRICFSGAALPDGVTGATALGHLRTAFTVHKDAQAVLAADFSPVAAVLGVTGGSMGETSELLVVLSGIWLLSLKVISWEVPVALLMSVTLFAALAHALDPSRYAGVLFHLGSGGLLLGAFFIATDPVTSPVSRLGRLIFGVGCGVMTWVIRTWGSFPEGVAFAVLFMNAVTPLLDRYCRPRIYGRTHRGQPLVPLSATSSVKGSENT